MILFAALERDLALNQNVLTGLEARTATQSIDTTVLSGDKAAGA
jgi:hypothetical protein